MITLQQILNSKSSILEGKKIKVVRHKDNREEYRDAIKDKQKLIEYQRTQPKDVFKGCDYIISFVGLDRNRCVLFGIFKVHDYTIINGEYDYNLELVPEFSDFIDRLVIDWGSNARAWHQWHHRNTKEVIEVLPQGYIGHFPGLLDFVLDFRELKILIDNPEANHEWCHHLSAVNGIYLILDSDTGLQYIGSASGNNGIWQRWGDYVANGNGGNKELIELQKSNPDYHHNFKFSVLQSLPSNITRREIIDIENLYKKKLGSRAHGLNNN